MQKKQKNKTQKQNKPYKTTQSKENKQHYIFLRQTKCYKT